MKKIILLCAICLFAGSVFAQTQKFDVMTYTAPKGWKAGQNGSAKVFSTVDKAAGKFCLMMLHPSITNHGTPSQDFAYVWKTLVQETFNAGGNPEKETTQADGFTIIQGGELIDYEGTKALALLTTVSGKGKVISLLAIMNDAKYATDLQNFLGAMDIDIKETPINPSVKTQPTNQTNAPLGNGEKLELWMSVSPGNVDSSGNYSLYDSKIDWKIVYPNGDYYPHLPRNGFLSFSRATSMNNPDETNSWGKLSFSGNNGSFRNKYENVEVTKLSSTKMKKVGYSLDFYKVASVDNLRLSGAYTLNFKDPDYSQRGCKRVIYFSNDGKFDDRGIFVSDCSQPNAYPKDSPGIGTYQLKNFTIVLQYDDGRTVTRSFSGVADKSLSASNEVFYLGGNPFFKN
jgi:hypothetical protein